MLSLRTTARRAAGIVVLAGIVGVAFALDLGRPHLWDPGEGRYAETVREMLLTGNWLVPTLDFVHYYDKPPGFFWMVAACFRVFGANEWAARLPAVIAAVLTIAMAVGFAWRRLGPATALGVGALLATTGEFVALGRSVRMDMPLAFAISGILLYAFTLLSDESPATEAPTWPVYVLAAIGTLVKGPVAVVLPMLVLGVFTLLTGRFARLRRLRPGWGAVVALVLASSWYAVAALSARDYLWAFLWQQNVGRFLQGGAGSGHSEPFWFYLWALPLTFLPWSLFLPGAAWCAVRRARRGHELDAFLLVWATVVFVFFTLSRAKLATYLLPMFPPLALMVATYLHEMLAAPAATQRKAFAVPTGVWAAALAGTAIVIAVGTTFRYPQFALHAASALALLAFPLAGLVLARRAEWRAMPALIFVAALASQMLFYRVGAPIVNEFSSLRTAAEIARALPDDAKVVSYRTRGHSFAFYAGRRLGRLRSPEDAAAALAGADPVGLLTKVKYLDRIQAMLTEPVCVWWQGVSGRVLLANRPFPDASRHAALLPGSGPRATTITTESPHC